MTQNKYIVEFHHFDVGDPVPRWIEEIDPMWLQDYSFFETEVIVQRMSDRVLINPLQPWDEKNPILSIKPPHKVYEKVYIDGAPTIIEKTPIVNLN